MTGQDINLTLLLASDTELPEAEVVWGTGGWIPAREREALDWLTLARLLGWGIGIIRPCASDTGIELSSAGSRVVVAGDPDRLGENVIAQLTLKLSTEPCLVLARAGAPGSAFARLSGAARQTDDVGGRSLRWSGPGPEQEWSCRNPHKGSGLDSSEENAIWATIDGVPTITARRVGCGVVATLGFHPSEARDANGAVTALLRRLLVWGVDQTTAWLDWEGTLILRMDDPGSAESVHHQIYSHSRMSEADWMAIGTDLQRRDARLSIGYVSGWVDDGDVARGSLKVAGRSSRRVPGKIHPSPLVQYERAANPDGNVIHDYISEFRGIQAIRKAGSGDVELHGYTHMHPDTASWASAPDRYESVQWYRELGATAASFIAGRPAGEHPLVRGMAAFRRFFKTQPTTLICPGEQWTNRSLECALQLGVQLVGSYYLAIRDGNRFCWAQHICSPYLDKPDPAWFDAGLPVVGYFHDFDVCRNGVEWFGAWLDMWQRAGAKRIIDYRELAAALSRRLRVEESAGGPCVKVRSEGGPALVRPLPVCIRAGHRNKPPEILVHDDDQTSMERSI